MMTSSGDAVPGVDHGPLLNIINWIFLVATCVLCLLKVLSKWVLIHQTQLDDVFMVAAMVALVLIHDNMTGSCKLTFS